MRPHPLSKDPVMNADNTTFALVWTACTIHMVTDITKRVKKFHANKTSK